MLKMVPLCLLTTSLNGGNKPLMLTFDIHYLIQYISRAVLM